MKYTHIIWDFNGTVLDDVDAGIRSVNDMLTARGLPVIASVAQYRELFGFPVIDYYRRLGLDVEKEDYYTILAPLWVSGYRTYARDAGAVKGVRTLLDAIAKTGTEQVLLSASECSLLREQLSALGVEPYFQQVYGLDNIHAHSKETLAQKWRDEHRDAIPLCIGDTLHDAEIARAIHADCVLFAGGHQSHPRLADAGFPVKDSMWDIGKTLGVYQ